MNYEINGRVLFDSNKGISPETIYAIMKTTLSSKDNTLETFRKSWAKANIDWDSIGKFYVTDFTDFTEFLIELVRVYAPTNVTTLSEVDAALMKNIPTFKAVKYLMCSLKRGVLIKKQNASRYGGTTPLMLYALKQLGYKYSHWKLDDPLLPEYLGPGLNLLPKFKLQKDLADKLIVAIAEHATKKEWTWYRTSSYPVRSHITGTITKAVGMPISPELAAIASGSWCNINNPSNIGAAIYDLRDWDFEPSVFAITEPTTKGELPW